MEHKTLNTDRKQHISVNTLVSDKPASDKQLTDSPKHPTSLHNVQDRMKKQRKQQSSDMNPIYSILNIVSSCLFCIDPV